MAIYTQCPRTQAIYTMYASGCGELLATEVVQVGKGCLLGEVRVHPAVDVVHGQRGVRPPRVGYKPGVQSTASLLVQLL